MNFTIIIIGIVAVAILEVLIEWLFRTFGIPPERPTKLQIVLGIIGVILIAIFLAIQSGLLQPSSPGTFSYQVRVQEEGTSRSIAGAKVTIEVTGKAPLDEITDSNGLARIFIDASYVGEPGRLLVEAKGYESHRQEIDLREGDLPDTVQLKPISPSETLTPSLTPTVHLTETLAATEAPSSRCGGTPGTLKTPSDPTDFDRELGFTVYNTGNSYTTASGGLVGNIVRSIFVDEDGVWIGYGTPPGGISYVSDPIDGGSRIWEACADAEGKVIGQLSNSITKDQRGDLWVATDGDGVWRLQEGAWEQFVDDPISGSGNLPHRATYTVVAQDGNILVGTLVGIVRYNGLTWTGLDIADQKQVHTIAFNAGETWIGFVEKGVRHIRADGSWQDYTMESGLGSDKVRSIAIDNEDRVWVGTAGGGISVFDHGSWAVYRGGQSGLLSDEVRILAIDKHGRVWAGTDKGVCYFDGKVWHTYSDLDTWTIGFGKSERERCSFDDEHVWIGTNGFGLTHGRLPAPSPVISDFRVNGIPDGLAPDETFYPSVVITLEEGYNLVEGDFLHAAGETSYTPHPFVVSFDTPSDDSRSYTFSFEDNPMTAPQEPGDYQSIWRLWQCGRYVGPPITIGFTVRSPEATSQSAPGSGSLLFQDDFDDGDAEGWAPMMESWNVVEGQYVCTSTRDARASAGENSWTDYTVRAQVRPESGSTISVGVIGRMRASNLFYLAELRNGEAKIVSRSNTVWATLAVAPYAVTSGTVYEIAVEFRGEHIRMYVNGELIVEAEDGLSSRGKIGLRCAEGSQALFDNVTVEALSE